MLHSFNALKKDGFSPTGHLAVIDGTIYGTTLYGGGQCYNNGGCGSVYRITTMGKENVIYGFSGPSHGNDGWLPEGGVIAAGGVLYGTTLTGGEGSCDSRTGCGIVYGVTTKGVERVLFRFDSASTGENPGAGLLAVRRHDGMGRRRLVLFCNHPVCGLRKRV